VTDYAATAALLAKHLDPHRFGDTRYLEWFYGANPCGPAIEEHVDDERGTRIAHYAVLPTTYRTPAGPVPFIFTSNVATDPGSRRRGLFREMAERVYPRAAATGAPGLAGHANDASTAVIVGRFGWGLLRPMPVVVALPLVPPRGVRDVPVGDALLDGAELKELGSDLDWVPVRDWVQSWPYERLRWRLARPDAGYVLHVGPDALVVSARDRAPLRVPAAVVLKVFPRPGARLPVRAGRYVTAACRAHRAPICVYAGWNAHATVRGVPVPMRLRPSPMNVVYKSFDEERMPSASFRIDTFELLDGDAY
jgi:hypothetical protein